MILHLIPKAAYDPAINSESRIFYSCPWVNNSSCLAMEGAPDRRSLLNHANPLSLRLYGTEVTHAPP